MKMEKCGSDCLEELVKFTLSNSQNYHIALSTEFCSTLLKDDPTQPSSSLDLLEGVPLYPLYKRLALVLLKCMDSQTFFWTGSCNSSVTNEIDNASVQKKHSEWHKLILDKISEILNILKSLSFEIHVQEPFFSQLKDGLKTVEGRCAGGKYSRFQCFTILKICDMPMSYMLPISLLFIFPFNFWNIWFSLSRIGLGNLILVNKSVVFEVQGIRWYPTFADMLETENLGKVLPGVDSVEKGVEIYRRFYTEEKEKSNGVLAIGVSKHTLQPYIPLANLFSELSYEGVQGLLGLMHTAGTIPDALPPPRSTLLASFSLLCNPDVRNSLTLGARALAKHACRSSSGYWGSLDGGDSNKNRLAMDVIKRLIAHCCWVNMHVVPPHGTVFEIRVAEGYGARWTEDGSKSPTWKMVTQKDGNTSSATIKASKSKVLMDSYGYLKVQIWGLN
ncbi:hypothetical protein Ahy_B08g094322 isoform B [Arachis hypogaea]|uniref:ASCH domain-containing protein n=1 Tax=Arachis hypogaea TaxID=3818 RepID=A0A444Y8L0_ARAHY|nr:hypothetical protein Ahy_B08g094322 isoform B [Arachis hypogaea]